MVAVLVYFGKDVLFFNQVFLPMDFLSQWKPWQAMLPKAPINNIVISDVAEQAYPYMHFIAQQLQAGHLPLWNPTVFLGLPTAMMAVTNFVMNPLYLLLFTFCSPATGHSAAILIDLSLIVSFSYLFFRTRGFSELSALCGSLVLAFNGVLMVWLEFMSGDFAYAVAMMSFYFFEKGLAERRWRFPLVNGAALGMLLLAGSVQWVFFLVPLLGLYALFRTWELWAPSRRRWENTRPFRTYVGPLVLAVLIALPNLWHFSEYMSLSHRTEKTFQVMQDKTGTFYPELLTTFIFPNFFGDQPGGRYFVRGATTVVYQNYNEMMVYMGVGTFVLALLAWRMVAFRNTALFWVSVIGLALVVAMKLPLLYFLLYHYVPGFNGMQPSRIFILLPPAFATLAAIGTEGLLRHPMDPRRASQLGTWSLVAVAALLLSLIGVHAYLTQHPIVVRTLSLAEHFQPGNPDFLYPLAWLALAGLGFIGYANGAIGPRTLCLSLIALIIIDLVPFGLRLNTRVDRSMVFPRPSAIRYLQQDPELFRTLPFGIPYNSLMAFDIDTLGGYASMLPGSYLQMLSAMEGHAGTPLTPKNPNYIAPKGLMSPLLPMLNVKYVIGPEGATLTGSAEDRYQLVHRSDLSIYQAKDYLPRAYAVYGYERTAGRAETIERLLRDDFDPRRIAVGEVAIEDVAAAEPASTPSPVVIARPSADRFELDVQMTQRGIVVVSEQIFPGWRAMLDGRPTAVFPVNGVLMGIVVPAGDHHITFAYRPAWFDLGRWGLIFGTSLILILLVYDWRRAANASKEET